MVSRLFVLLRSSFYRHLFHVLCLLSPCFPLSISQFVHGHAVDKVSNKVTRAFGSDRSSILSSDRNLNPAYVVTTFNRLQRFGKV